MFTLVRTDLRLLCVYLVAAVTRHTEVYRDVISGFVVYIYRMLSR